MLKSGVLFDQFCYVQASFESSRHVYRREHGPGQVRRFFNTSFTAFELRRYMRAVSLFLSLSKSLNLAGRLSLRPFTKPWSLVIWKSCQAPLIAVAAIFARRSQC